MWVDGGQTTGVRRRLLDPLKEIVARKTHDQDGRCVHVGRIQIAEMDIDLTVMQ